MPNDIRRWIQLSESSMEDDQATLPEDVIVAFCELGAGQRFYPEHAMLEVQKIAGSGVLSLLVEHVGDITHRMAHMARYGSVMGREKILKTLRWLNDGYGFEREMEENIVANARSRKVKPSVLRKDVSEALRWYATAHAQLKVYNRAQWLARQSAVSIGLENFNDARRYLTELAVMAKTEDSFTKHALEYSRDADGKISEYRS